MGFNYNRQTSRRFLALAGDAIHQLELILVWERDSTSFPVATTSEIQELLASVSGCVHVWLLEQIKNPL